MTNSVCIIYPNDSNTRESIFSKLVGWSKKRYLHGIAGQHFRIDKDWPPKNVLENFPLNLQIEEVVIENDEVITIRKLVIDSEVLRIPYQKEE